MKIEISDAKVSTAQVEVKTLAIKGKQVTLAVFRQIDVGDIMSLDIENFRYTLRGFPWGRVNYCTKDCHRHGDHLHIIWQFEDELRTCIAVDSVDKHLLRIFPKRDWDYEEVRELIRKSSPSYNEIYESFTRLPLLFIAV